MASDERIAIVGAACRLPGATDLDAYWRLLTEGRSALERLTPATAARSAAHRLDPTAADWVGVCAPLDDAERFDAEFFGYSAREAQVMDPQQRVVMECAYEALEDAAITPASVDHAVGVYLSSTASTFLLENASSSEMRAALGIDAIALVNNADFVPTAISYRLDLRGPSVAIQTACSGSLVAVHLASNALRDAECDLALAGGVSVRIPQRTGYHAPTGGVTSPSGACRPFAADADGTVFGSGAGVVVLQRLEDAVARGSRIMGVIVGSAINNDGRERVGFTAPSQRGQAGVIAEALAVAGLTRSQIGYVEAHGTATRLGDEIEVRALAEVFGGDDRAQPLLLGSCKGNIAHAESAAGIAGFLKALLVLRHGAIPATLGTGVTPLLDLHRRTFAVPRELIPWPEGVPRRAGVSSFGIGGTNAHVVLEEAPPAALVTTARAEQPRLVTLSAATSAALSRRAQDLAAFLDAGSPSALADVAYTLHVGRRVLAHRSSVVARTPSEAARRLRAAAVTTAAASPPRLVFLFPGQATDVVAMARGLRDGSPLFRRYFDDIAAEVARSAGPNLQAALWSGPDLDTDVGQPLIVATSLALVETLRALGVVPHVVLGHSLGEWTAGVASGALARRSALAAVAARGRLMATTEPGAMVAVTLAAEALAERLRPGLVIAAVNGRAATVLSGAEAPLADLCAELDDLGIPWARLPTRRAFHSPLMDPILAPLRSAFVGLHVAPPSIPWISSLDGRVVEAAGASDPDRWVEHARRPVDFFTAVEAVRAIVTRPGGSVVALEIGPGRTLASAARHVAGQEVTAISLCPRPDEDPVGQFLDAIGRIHAAGASVRFDALYDGERRARVALPPYPFERTRHPPVIAAPSPATAPALARTVCVPSWRRLDRPAAAPRPSRVTRWLALVRPGGDRLVEILRERGADVIEAVASDAYARLGPARFNVRADVEEDMVRVVAEAAPSRAAHLWSVGAVGDDERDRGFVGALHLIRALAPIAARSEVRVFFVSEGAYDVIGTEAIVPPRAALGALARVASQEIPGLFCGHVDRADANLAAVADEILATSPRPVLAARGARFFAPAYPRLAPAPAGGGSLLRRGGVYLVVGGTGRFGSIVTRALVERWDARVAVIARGRTNPGAAIPGVEVLQGDVRDRPRIARLVGEVVARHGGLDGVIYAAGTIDDQAHCPILELGKEVWKEHFAVRVEGIEALASALEGVPVGFRLITSSMAPILGGLGLAAYGAANAWVDAYVDAHPGWRAIHWEGWHRADARATAYSSSAAETQRRRIFTDEEVVLAFEEALQMHEVRRIVITRNDLEERLADWIHPSGAATVTCEAARPRGVEDTAGAVAEIVASLLGVAAKPDDDLFQLGANSLTAVQILARVRAAFQINLPLRALFEGPTVAQIAQAVALELGDVGDGERVIRLLDEIEALSDDEVEAALERAGRGKA